MATGPLATTRPIPSTSEFDFTVPEHGFRRKIRTFMFEVRQDLVDTRETAARKAAKICEGLLAVLANS